MPPAEDVARREFRRAWACTAAFGAGLSGLTTVLVVLARSCFENPAPLLVLCPLVLTAAVFVPFVLSVRWQEAVPRFVFPLLTLLVLLSPMLLGLGGRPLALVYPLLAALGIGRAARPLASAGSRAAALLAIDTAVLAPYFLSEILRQPYAHIFVPEYALLGPGLLARDTLLHARVAHMIQAFGVASTGLDGLVPFRYHVASHAWFAGIGRLAGSTPLGLRRPAGGSDPGSPERRGGRAAPRRRPCPGAGGSFGCGDIHPAVEPDVLEPRGAVGLPSTATLRPGAHRVAVGPGTRPRVSQLGPRPGLRLRRLQRQLGHHGARRRGALRARPPARRDHRPRHRVHDGDGTEPRARVSGLSVTGSRAGTARRARGRRRK